VGLPQLDFRVPEGTWLKSALAGKLARMPGLSRLGSMPGLSTTGALAWPYKVAVVAVMALVACGTLVTFGSAGAETPSSAEVSALPGTDEASPRVEGQVLPPTNQTLLNSQDLLSSLNLTDYSPEDTTTFSLSDDDDESDEDNDDESTTSDTKKKPAATKPTPKPTGSSDGGSDNGGSDDGGSDDGGSTPTPSPTPTQTSEPEPVCHDERVWVPASGTLKDGNLKLGHYETKEVCD